MSHSHLPSFPKSREVNSLEVCLFFIIHKLKHIPAVAITDNAHSIAFDTQMLLPRVTLRHWPYHHTNLHMNCGKDKQIRLLSPPSDISVVCICCKCQKIPHFIFTAKKAFCHPTLKAFINVRINRNKRHQKPHNTYRLGFLTSK